MKNFISKNKIFWIGLLGCFLNCWLNPTMAWARQAKQAPSDELVGKAWEASGRNDLEVLAAVVDQCVAIYGEEAREEGSQLTGFPLRGEEKNYQSLNDVATCLFIQGEAFMNNGKSEDALIVFKEITEEYKWAQAWDPSRGSFWSVAEKSQSSIDILTGQEEEEEVVEKIKSIPVLRNPGKEKVVDYSKYGEFLHVGTPEYSYRVNDPQGLAEAVGEGLYPNGEAFFKDPRYRELRKEGRLKGNHWDFVNTDDLEAAFYKWLSAPEPWGTKLFYLGIIYEKARMYSHALKAYRALVVHFPKSVAWTYWQTPWYPAQAAIAKIKHILRTHPELGLEAKWMKIIVKNGFDNDIKNDVIITYPGVIREKGLIDRARDKLQLNRCLNLGEVKKQIGKGRIYLAQYENGHWQLMVDNRPYIIKGVTYSPTKVGQSPDKGTLADWTKEDRDGNGRLDSPYDSWVDANFNNKRDDNEPVVGDFQLLKNMGANTIREYHQPFQRDKAALREMYRRFGFRVMMGDYLGKYTLGSGASWREGTDYANPEHQKNMLESVKRMVLEFKDEPYILLWVLGNENNYGVASNADKNPEAYFKFVNEAARMIKSIDPDHPVAICNGDTLFLDIFSKFCPDVDIYAANVYRGDYGFGSFWEQVAEASGKPAFITEYGCPAYVKWLTLKEAEEAQSNYHLGNWMDIQENLAGQEEGAGNALGGVVFEWLDEWWKNYEPYRHDKKSDAIGPFPGGYYYEEWFGIIGQGNGRNSPFLRQLRKSYFTYQDLWN
ncbi:MAG: glycoside hydrolase family 2 TIM barrel-domain containing protein [Candidatus Omnitrophota bacterium]